MKFLLLALAFYALFWLLRRTLRAARRAPDDAAGRAAAAARAAEPMLQCAECGLHLPRDEALPGAGGSFCSSAHRAAHERAHAPRS